MSLPATAAPSITHTMLSPAQSCLPDHLSHAMKFLTVREFTTAIRTCHTWYCMGKLNSSWPTHEELDLDLSNRLVSLDPSNQSTGLPLCIRFKSDSGGMLPVGEQLRDLVTRKMGKKIQDLYIQSNGDHENEKEIFTELTHFSYLTNLTFFASDPAGAEGFIEHMATRDNALRTLVLGISSLGVTSLTRLPSFHALRQLLIIFDDKSPIPEGFTPAAIKPLVQLVDLEVHGAEGIILVDTHMALTLRYLSIHGNLRRLTVSSISSAGINALVFPPHRIPGNEHILLPLESTLPAARLTHFTIHNIPSNLWLNILSLPDLRKLDLSFISLEKLLPTDGILSEFKDQLSRGDPFSPAYRDPLQRDDLPSREFATLQQEFLTRAALGFGRLEGLDTRTRNMTACMSGLLLFNRLRKLRLSWIGTGVDPGFTLEHTELLVSTMPLMEDFSATVTVQSVPLLSGFHALRKLDLELQEEGLPTLADDLAPLSSLQHLCEVHLLLSKLPILSIGAEFISIMSHSPSWCLLRIFKLRTDGRLRIHSDDDIILSDALHLSLGRMKHIRLVIKHGILGEEQHYRATTKSTGQVHWENW